MRRGFTLVELLIATMSGLIIAAAAFLLARNSSSFFQSEAGITTAQFSSMLGFSRLQEDVRRAAMMSSPNIVGDPMRCGSVAGWPAGMAELAGVRIEQGGSVIRHAADHTLSVVNGTNPDALIIGGLFGSTEHFAIQAMSEDGSGGFTILLQNDGAMIRAKLGAGAGAAALNQLFRVGRILRLQDGEGRSAYGVISGVNTGGTFVVLSVANSPTLPIRSTAGTCGCSPPCEGDLVNPVVRMLYDVRKVDEATYPQYAGLYVKASRGAAAVGTHAGITQAPRTELIRVELDASGAEIVDTLEILAEYAVDFKLGMSTATPGPPPDNVPVITYYNLDDPAIAAIAGPLAAGTSPQRVRSLQIRLGIRAARRDRAVAITNPADGGFFRFDLGIDGAGNPRGFARVRTLVADVALPNQTGVSW
ncbi:MAG TPA: hypothetical protein ENK23_02355 [Sorangium sp.]|nr:hypothetical protein [Sorangium sp.]